MVASITKKVKGQFKLEERGYVVLYRQRQVNHCPGCGRSNWYVGRLTAECAFCATAIFLDDSSSSSTRHTRGNSLHDHEHLAA